MLWQFWWTRSFRFTLCLVVKAFALAKAPNVVPLQSHSLIPNLYLTMSHTNICQALANHICMILPSIWFRPMSHGNPSIAVLSPSHHIVRPVSLQKKIWLIKSISLSLSFSCLVKAAKKKGPHGEDIAKSMEVSMHNKSWFVPDTLLTPICTTLLYTSKFII